MNKLLTSLIMVLVTFILLTVACGCQDKMDGETSTSTASSTMLSSSTTSSSTPASSSTLPVSSVTSTSSQTVTTGETVTVESEKVTQYIQNGISLLNQEKYEQAISEFDRAIELDSNLPPAYFYRGIARGKTGEYDNAIADFTMAIKLNPDGVPARFNRGFTYEQIEEYEKAIADYSKAIELDPAFAPAYEHRGMVYKITGDKQQAIADLEKFLEVSQDPSVVDRVTEALDELQMPELCTACEVASLKVHYPHAIELGEEVVIEIRVRNLSEVECIYLVALNINGEPVETREVTVPAKGMRIGNLIGCVDTTFHFSPDKLGTYNVAVGEESGTFWVINEFELTDALSRNLVVARASGAGLQRVTLEMESLSEDPLGIVVLPLTLFKSGSPGVQNMLSIMPEQSYAVLEAPGTKEVLDIPAVCANMHLSMPGEVDIFTIERPSLSEDLAKLHQETLWHWASSRIQQFSIWVITDNPRRTEFTQIGTTQANVSGPSTEEIEEMREIFEAAGIDVSKYLAFH